MSRKARGSRRLRLEQVRGRVERWRQTRAGRCRMPEELWHAAVLLADEHGVYGTAHGLRISYDTLKARVAAVEKRNAGQQTEFVELSGGISIGGSASGSVVELLSSSGEKLTIRLGGAGELSVVELCRDFWSRAR